MVACSEHKTVPEPDPFAALERETDDAIEACDGDVRAAVRALIVTMHYLEERVKHLLADVSRGYTRGVHDGLYHPLLRSPPPSSESGTNEPSAGH